MDDSAQDRHVAHAVGNRICGNGGSSKSGHQTQNQNFAKLKHAVFQAVRDADVKNLLQNPPFQANSQNCTDVQRLLWIFHPEQHPDAGKHTGNRGRNRRSLHAEPEAIKKNGISTRFMPFITNDIFIGVLESPWHGTWLRLYYIWKEKEWTR